MSSVWNFQPCLTLWGPVRLFSPFPPLPLWKIALAKFPAKGGQSASKGGITMRLEAQVEPTEAIQHPAGTATAAASGSHFVVFIILFILGHLSIIIILFMWRRKFCLWTSVCGPCCACNCPDQHTTVDEPQPSHPDHLCIVGSTQSQITAQRESCLWMCCVSTAHFYSILGCFHQLLSEKRHWAKPTRVVILIFLKTLVKHPDNEY